MDGNGIDDRRPFVDSAFSAGVSRHGRQALAGTSKVPSLPLLGCRHKHPPALPLTKQRWQDALSLAPRPALPYFVSGERRRHHFAVKTTVSQGVVGTVLSCPDWEAYHDTLLLQIYLSSAATTATVHTRLPSHCISACVAVACGLSSVPLFLFLSSIPSAGPSPTFLLTSVVLLISPFAFSPRSLTPQACPLTQQSLCVHRAVPQPASQSPTRALQP